MFEIIRHSSSSLNEGCLIEAAASVNRAASRRQVDGHRGRALGRRVPLLEDVERPASAGRRGRQQ